MKKISIKVRLTIWYTLFVLVISLTLYGIVFTGTRAISQQNAARDLERALSLAAEEVEFDDGEIEFDNIDLLETYREVHFSIHALDGTLLLGNAPSVDASFQEGNPKTVVKTVVDTSGRARLVQDVRVPLKKRDDVWLRGTLSLASSQNAYETLAKLFGITLPFFILIAAVGGYLLAKKAFRPIANMTQTVHAITDGEDLEKRIVETGPKDEIWGLACAFNEMLARIQKSFATERRFTSDAAHELRTPLAIIQAQGEYALSTSSTAEKDEGLAVIHNTCDRMNKLLSQLLLLARMDADTHVLIIEDIDLSSMLEGIADEMTPLCQPKGLTFQLQLPPSAFIKGDQMLLMQAFMNIINNAIEYSKPDGRIWIGLAESTCEVSVTIRDEGIGIAASAMPHIWDRFFRGDPSRANQNENSGLGLSIVHWIVAKHKGRVSAESAEGVGSTFTIVLPKK